LPAGCAAHSRHYRTEKRRVRPRPAGLIPLALGAPLPRALQEHTSTFTTAELNGVVIPYAGQARTPVNRDNLQRRLRWRLLWAGCVCVPSLLSWRPRTAARLRACAALRALHARITRPLTWRRSRVAAQARCAQH
jgi:hypothetical protein